MNIAFFTDTYLPDVNGVVSSCVTLKESLEKLGHKVYVITNHSGTKISREGDVLRLPGIELKRLYGYKMSSPFQLAADRYIEDMDLDVIHVQTEYGVALYGRQIARDYNIPLVYTYHTMWEDYTHYFNPMELSGVERMSKAALRSISRTYGNGGQAVIAPSQKTREALLGYGVITPIYVVPTGLDLSRFDMTRLDPNRVEQIREELGLEAKHHVALFVGRLAKEKMLDMVIDAVVQSEDPDLRLVIVGSGPDAQHFRDLAMRTDTRNRILFTGQVPGEDVPYYYALGDCFVSASTSETQGMTYIEALAAGLPVFGRRDPVLQDLVEEGKSGYYFDDAKELLEKLTGFFSQEKRDWAPDCIARTRSYTEEIFGSKVATVYEQAISDYQQTYNVGKMQAMDDYMYLTLQRDADPEPLKILIPIDDFFELKIGLQARLDKWVVDNYLKFQTYYQAWVAAKKKLASRDMTAWQLRDWLVRRRGLETSRAATIAEEFEQRHYIDDKVYARKKAAYWQSMGSSRKAIRRKLVKDGVTGALIDEVMAGLDPALEYASARTAASAMLQSMKQQSARRKKQSVVSRLVNRGFSPEIARRAGEDLDLEAHDQESLTMALENARRLYAALDPVRRREKLMEYGLRKGFTRDEISACLDRTDPETAGALSDSETDPED